MNPKIVLGARVSLGLIFLVPGGLNGYAMILTGKGFLPMPPPTQPMADFMGALFASGYFIPLLKTTELITGLMLLFNFHVPLALIILAPIVINIVGVHIFLDMGRLPMALFIVVLQIFLAYSYRDSFQSIFTQEP